MKEEISDTASLKNSEGASYYSSEHTGIKKRPKLTVTYTSTPIVYVQPDPVHNRVTVFKDADNLSIKTSRYTGYTATLFNTQGKRLCSAAGLKDRFVSMPIQSLSHGIYILQLTAKQVEPGDCISLKLVW